MLQYDRIDVSKGNGIEKTKPECIICHYWYFLEINFSFQPKESDGCHELMQKNYEF